MDKEKYQAALKEVRTVKGRDNFMLIEISYDKKMVLPYKDGLTLMAALINAEELKKTYGDPGRINPWDMDALTTRIMSYTEYEQYKIAALLNITVEQVKEFAAQASTG